MYGKISRTYGLVVAHSFTPQLDSLNLATVNVSKSPVFGKLKNSWEVYYCLLNF